jgi:hypothetical protein
LATRFFDEEGRAGHDNPDDKISARAEYDFKSYADSATINGLTVKNLDDLGLRASEITLSADIVESGKADFIRENRIYIDNGEKDDPNSPEIGDIRITYYEVKDGVDGLIIGKLNGSSITAFDATRKTAFKTNHAKLYRWLDADNIDDAVLELKAEHDVQVWIFRIIGTVLVYIAFLLLLNPLTTLLSVIPFVGKLTRGLAALILLPAAIIVSAIAIIIAALLNNIITFIILVAGLIALTVRGIVKKKNAKTAAAG